MKNSVKALLAGLMMTMFITACDRKSSAPEASETGSADTTQTVQSDTTAQAPAGDTTSNP